MIGHAMHDHSASHGAAPVLAAAVALAAVVLYLAGAVRLRGRGHRWSRGRDAAFALGGVGLAIAATMPMPGGEFTAHMARHLIVGMVSPLLLVVGRPVTLALRVLGPRLRRALLGVVRSRPAGWLVYPPLAALLDVGGMWVLYRTPLIAGTHGGAWLHALAHVHMFLAGLLFSAAVCQLEPLRRRYSVTLRAATLVAAAAAHAVLAKSLYGTPPPGTGFAVADVQTGAQLMYYGGDVVEVGLAVVLAAKWYAAGGRALTRERRRSLGTRTSAGR
jgi:putative membrane protein